MKSTQLRVLRDQFRKSKNHMRTDAASLIVNSADDPTTMFNTAGMQPLVPYLMGKDHPTGAKRVYNIQGCMRTVDIDEVGDVSHLTYFEMMGNWSLGDYFKKESIARSWEFLTSSDYLGLDTQMLCATIFEGDTDAPLDEEAKNIWLDYLPEHRITPLDKKENWRGPAGATGPCGPDSEIFYWVGPGNPPVDSHPGNDEENWLEIWNNVFMEYYKSEEKTEKERSEEVKNMLDEKTGKIIGLAIEVHKKYHNTLTENQIQAILYDKLVDAGFSVQKEMSIAIQEDGKSYGNRFVDLVVDDNIFIELKNNPHSAEVKKGFRQLRSYLELGNGCAGLLLNFTFEKLDITRFNHYQGKAFDDLLQTSGSSFSLLDQRNVDTGMGFERILMVMKGQALKQAGKIEQISELSVYDIDIFQSLLEKLSTYAAHPYPKGAVVRLDIDRLVIPSYRIVADHLRTALFLVNEGLAPSNEGRGYVLRRIIRRAYYHLKKISLESEDRSDKNLLHTKITDISIGLTEFYPSLSSNFIQDIHTIVDEMRQFEQTLQKGGNKLDDLLSQQSGSIFSGSDAFLLYDTFGVPVELTQEIVAGHGLSVDMAGFSQALETAKQKSRAGAGDKFTKGIDWAGHIDGLPETEFVGYDTLELENATILKDFMIDAQRYLVFDMTPFYAEGGGQKGDSGTIELDSGEVVEIIDVIKYGGVWLHKVG